MRMKLEHCPLKKRFSRCLGNVIVNSFQMSVVLGSVYLHILRTHTHTLLHLDFYTGFLNCYRDPHGSYYLL